eukprot:2234555-Amphidinium_carterae.1
MGQKRAWLCLAHRVKERVGTTGLPTPSSRVDAGKRPCRSLRVLFSYTVMHWATAVMVNCHRGPSIATAVVASPTSSHTDLYKNY